MDELKADILMVDDEPKNLLALEGLLEPLGQNLLRAHGLPLRPTRSVYGDVAGDGMFEQPAQFDRVMTQLVLPQTQPGR